MSTELCNLCKLIHNPQMLHTSVRQTRSLIFKCKYPITCVSNTNGGSMSAPSKSHGKAIVAVAQLRVTWIQADFCLFKALINWKCNRTYAKLA
jgi:hypothetical protein